MAASPPSSHSYLYHVDKVKEELLGILLPIGGKLGVALANEGLEHSRGNAILHFLCRARVETQWVPSDLAQTSPSC